MCCTRLAANTGHKKSSKNRHLGTIAQLCRAISSQLRHVSTIGEKLIKQQYLLHMSSQYGELQQPISSWDRFVSLGHPCKFQRVSGLGNVTARHSSIGRQPNFAAMNRGRHRYSAGRPSRWASTHILVSYVLQTWALVMLQVETCRKTLLLLLLLLLLHKEVQLQNPWWTASIVCPMCGGSCLKFNSAHFTHNQFTLCELTVVSTTSDVMP